MAFVAAALVATVLIVGAVFLRGDSNGSAAAFPPVNLKGIPQSGNVLGSSSAHVTLIEYADPQCPACRLYTETIVPTVVNDYVRPGKIDTEYRGFPFIGPDSVKGVPLPSGSRRAGEVVEPGGGVLPVPGR